MAEQVIPAAWGIDIGQAGLKAIRLRYAEAAGQVLAVAFDYVPHPKILSQPDANADELIAQALDTFLSRNDVKGDRVAIGLPGQSALARFIQLPPVEAGKIKDIVQFEARQQIPFALEEVIWDWQTLGGGEEEGGFMLNAEVGLFAMKRDQVEKAMAPFTERKVEVDLVQVDPLALYNFISYDRLGVRAGEDYSGLDEHALILDMGADGTTLLVTNGGKIWLRNIPIGGNHFTRALTKEMKLTFAKAEHLKQNATKAPNPREVFQALRPVFNDYVSEIQRSIGFFASANRDAKITKIYGAGNGFKLAGLQKFLQQNLQYEVERVDSFQALVGDSVLNAGLFKDNVMSFTVPYGLAIQALDQTRIETSLLPPEIVAERKIRAKKPWLAAAAATLLLGVGLSAMVDARANRSVAEETWKTAEGKSSQVAKRASDGKSEYGKKTTEHETIEEENAALTSPLEGHPYWSELYKAVDVSLPAESVTEKAQKDPTKRKRFRIVYQKTRWEPNLATWYENLKKTNGTAFQRMAEHDRAAPPKGGGYVVEMKVEHYHMPEKRDVRNLSERGVGFVKKYFVDNLQSWEINGIPIGKLGINYATILEANETPIDYSTGAHRPTIDRGKPAGGGKAGAGGGHAGGAYVPPMDEPPPTTDDDTGAGDGTAEDTGGAAPPALSGAGVGGGGGHGGGPTVGGNVRPGGPRKSTDATVRKIQQTTAIVEFAWQPVAPDKRAAARPKVEGDAAAQPAAPTPGPVPVKPPGGHGGPAGS